VEDVVPIVKVVEAEPPDARLTLPGSMLREGPEGFDVAVKDTVPENPLTLVKSMPEKPESPATSVITSEFATIVKSGVGGGTTIIVLELVPVLLAESVTVRAGE